MLSCGSWGKRHVRLEYALQESGDSRCIGQTDTHRTGRIRTTSQFYSEATLAHEKGWRNFSSAYIEGPVYLSIDKDVLNPASAVTDWDQGSFSLQELEELLAIVLRKERVVGIDICGECLRNAYCLRRGGKPPWTAGRTRSCSNSYSHSPVFYKAVGYC